MSGLVEKSMIATSTESLSNYARKGFRMIHTTLGSTPTKRAAGHIHPKVSGYQPSWTEFHQGPVVQGYYGYSASKIQVMILIILSGYSAMGQRSGYPSTLFPHHDGNGREGPPAPKTAKDRMKSTVRLAPSKAPVTMKE